METPECQVVSRKSPQPPRQRIYTSDCQYPIDKWKKEHGAKSKGTSDSTEDFCLPPCIVTVCERVCGLFTCVHVTARDSSISGCNSKFIYSLREYEIASC